MRRPCSSAQLAEDGWCQEGRGWGSDTQKSERPEGPEGPERTSRREKKHNKYMLCEVCNVQLNSLAQAQIHYNGKSHQKKLKQMSSGKQRGNVGSPGQNSPLLASLPVLGRPLQPQLDLKRFLPFRLGGSSPVSLFPNFNAMDPVQKAVINHTFGVPQPLKKKQIISCNICHLRFNSTNQAEAHYKGHKHARKLKAMEAQKNKQRNLGASLGWDRERDRERAKVGVPEALAPLMDGMEGTNQDPKSEPSRLKESPGSCIALTPSPDSPSLEAPTTASPRESPASHPSECASDSGAAEVPAPAIEPGSRGPAGSEGEPRAEGDRDPRKHKQHLHCPVCKVTVNSCSQLEAHNSGSKHKLMLEGQSVQPRRRNKVVSSRVACKTRRLGGKGSVRGLSKSFHCDLCEINVNSETQLKQHIGSRRHKDRLAGKPPRAKFSPYSKGPQSSLLASARRSGTTSGVMCAVKKVFSPYSLTSLCPQTKLALQKQLTKGLTASFLPSPLSPAALCTMAANPLALRHPAGTTSLIQTPLLSPALFRPAPGPLRATHAPIIFSPY